MADGAQRLTQAVHAKMDDGLSKLMVPAHAAPGDASHAVPTIRSALPGFAYSEVLRGETAASGALDRPRPVSYTHPFLTNPSCRRC
eukprot:55335-Eustigmatos_ZCMA.PRE.1